MQYTASASAPATTRCDGTKPTFVRTMSAGKCRSGLHWYQRVSRILRMLQSKIKLFLKTERRAHNCALLSVYKPTQAQENTQVQHVDNIVMHGVQNHCHGTALHPYIHWSRSLHSSVHTALQERQKVTALTPGTATVATLAFWHAFVSHSHSLAAPAS